MKQGYPTLDRHFALLKEKGFTENALDAQHTPKTLQDTIKEAFHQCKERAHYTNQDQSFAVNFIGWFNQRLDNVLFRFLYRYDSERQQIKLMAVRAQMDQHKKLILVVNPKMLSSAQTIYNEMNRERKILAARHLLQKPTYAKENRKRI